MNAIKTKITLQGGTRVSDGGNTAADAAFITGPRGASLQEFLQAPAGMG